MLNALLEHARQNTVIKGQLNAQTTAVGFYQRSG